MDVPPHEAKEKKTVTILVTGANSGLGFTTCTRLIDEFLQTRPQSQTLHLLYTTRDQKKSTETHTRLRTHLQRTLARAYHATSTPTPSVNSEARINFTGHLVDLTNLPSVRALATQLLARAQRLDACIWNAGVAGWLGVDWPRAIAGVLAHPVEETTYPSYMRCDTGARTKPQTAASDEPPLGQVFAANVFGHYMLSHWLAPLMGEGGKLIWMSSISGTKETFDTRDLQGLRAPMAYEGSKRLTDLLVLTSELPSTQAYVKSFLPETAGANGAAKANGSAVANGHAAIPGVAGRPRMYVVHPGVVSTSIAGLNVIMGYLMLCAFYLARWVGSPWHLIEPYKGSVSAVFAALDPPEQLDELEARDGKGKWGSACDVLGEERVARTEVEGWGFGGVVGRMPGGSLGGSKRGWSETTGEMREDFEVVGGRVWKEMEMLREEWEERLGEVKAVESVDA